jgi:hypothetical protein
MSETPREVKRSLRIDLLKISDLIQELSLKYRDRGLDQDYAIELNDLQIKAGEIIGKLWNQ